MEDNLGGRHGPVNTSLTNKNHIDVGGTCVKQWADVSFEVVDEFHKTFVLDTKQYVVLVHPAMPRPRPAVKQAAVYKQIDLANRFGEADRQPLFQLNGDLAEDRAVFASLLVPPNRINVDSRLLPVCVGLHNPDVLQPRLRTDTTNIVVGLLVF